MTDRGATGRVRERADVLIVGAGSAGAVLAARLSADPSRRVMLIEAGPDPGPSESSGLENDASFFDALARPGRIWPELVGRRSPQVEPAPYLRGRGLGGSSAVNAMIAIPGIPDDHRRWVELGATGWGWEDVAPWFGRTALALSVAGAAEHGPISRALLAALPHAASAVPLTRDASGRRSSTNEAYLEPARQRPNLEVRTGVLVDRLLLDGRRVVGVRTADGEDVEAADVIVSAGAIHSPAVLLRSGIQRAGIGGNLRDHPAVAIPLRYHDGGPDPWSLPISVIARRSSGEEPADLQLLAIDHLGRAAPGVGMLMAALMQARSAGHVRLASSNPRVDPVVELDLLRDEADERRLRIGVEQAVAVLEHPAFRDVATAEIPDVGGAAIFEHLGEYVHAAGTCRMGAIDDDDAVVDPSCRVIGYEGVMVCDASVMPDLPRANPHLTTVVIAERIAALYAAASSSSNESRM